MEYREFEDGIPVGKIVKWCLVAFVGFIALGWLTMGNNFFMYKFFAPKQEAVRREVFEQTRSFNQGMVQELQNMQFEYVKTADTNAKSSLASIILHRAAGYNLSDPIVPAELRSFIEQLKRERAEAR